jgi:DNA processing protein|tara:strand:- start:182 stop:1102 length:921 start_codon:yes stop_codon:yes gene_type:complete
MASSKTLLSLLNLDGYGKKKVIHLIEELKADLDTSDDVIRFLSGVSGMVKGIKVPDASQAKSAIQMARDTIRSSEDAGVYVLGYADKKYPDRLRTIPDPPPVLFAKGDLAGLSSAVSVALIGTREPSDFGRKSAFAIGKSLAEFGITVVSGLALGCDTEGHLGCLEGRGTTVAVMAHGLDQVLPARNRPLAKRILSEGGCLVSEHALGVSAQRYSFVERDRLQSGLSNAVVVVETGVGGGSMHTVGFCKEQRRKLACVSPPDKNADAQFAEGHRMLISKGAKSLRNKGDVSELVGSILDRPTKLRP